MLPVDDIACLTACFQEVFFKTLVFWSLVVHLGADSFWLIFFGVHSVSWSCRLMSSAESGRFSAIVPLNVLIRSFSPPGNSEIQTPLPRSLVLVFFSLMSKLEWRFHVFCPSPSFCPWTHATGVHIILFFSSMSASVASFFKVICVSLLGLFLYSSFNTTAYFEHLYDRCLRILSDGSNTSSFHCPSLLTLSHCNATVTVLSIESWISTILTGPMCRASRTDRFPWVIVSRSADW